MNTEFPNFDQDFLKNTELEGTLKTRSPFPLMYRFNFAIELDLKFWSLLPGININLHCKSIELQFLCMEIHFDKVN